MGKHEKLEPKVPAEAQEFQSGQQGDYETAVQHLIDKGAVQGCRQEHLSKIFRHPMVNRPVSAYQ